MNTKATSYTWFVTVFPETHPWTFPEKLPKGVKYMKGQLEQCPTTKRSHYHVFLYMEKNSGYRQVQKLVFNNLPVNCQIPRVNDAADKYVSKDDTRIAGPWALGVQPKKSKASTMFFNDVEPSLHGACSSKLQKYLCYNMTRQPDMSDTGSDWSLVDEETNNKIMGKLLEQID
jgi:hypothetical protein